MPELIVKYSRLERVAHADELEHPIFREAFRLLEMDGRSVEIASMADLPAGTGLGSSGSFTTALLKALHTRKKDLVHPRELAEEACHIEIDVLKEEIGKQDQYISAYGGLTCFEFCPDGRVDARVLPIASQTLYTLEDNLLLFFTGYSRSASKVLQDQNQRSLRGDEEVERNLTELKDIARRTADALVDGDFGCFAELLNVQWEQKRRRSGISSNADINSWYRLGMENGALGGKLVGAGGGGFLMFYAEEKTRLRKAMLEAGLREVRFRFDFEGTKVVTVS
ncbi:MAG: galactokinase [Chloroflexi bacterium]|nr:galactokinase [Chloroflexota bacterium]